MCELPEQEFFFSRLTLASGAQVITVNPNEARVIIDDRADCPSELVIVSHPAVPLCLLSKTESQYQKLQKGTAGIKTNDVC